MPKWLGTAVDIGLGLLGVGGGLATNASNRREGERNRRFQERMSSTAVQRAVEDYRKAGLNPALAYDRPASSPGGSVVQVDDAVGKGISSGLAARTARAQVQAMQEQVRKTHYEANTAAANAVVAQAQAAPWQVDGPGSLRDEWTRAQLAKARFEVASQPYQLDQLKAMAMLQQAAVPGAKAEADWWSSIGKAGPWMKGLAPLLRLIKPR